MPADLLSAIVTLLAIVLYFYMSVRVGQMRQRVRRQPADDLGDHGPRCQTQHDPETAEPAIEGTVVHVPARHLRAPSSPSGALIPPHAASALPIMTPGPIGPGERPECPAASPELLGVDLARVRTRVLPEPL